VCFLSKKTCISKILEKNIERDKTLFSNKVSTIGILTVVSALSEGFAFVHKHKQLVSRLLPGLNAYKTEKYKFYLFGFLFNGPQNTPYLRMSFNNKNKEF